MLSQFLSALRQSVFPVFAALILSGCSGASAETLSDAQASEIDAIAKGIMTAANYPSVVVLIDKGGKTIYSGSFGTANIEHDLKPTADTPYAIGSITKSFTAFAVLKLVDEGRIDLDAPVSQYLSDYNGAAADVAVRHLLDHTNGIPNYTAMNELRPRFEREAFSRSEMVDTFEGLPLEFEQGDKFNYTNSGYYLLGLIIESVSGQSYYDFLEQNVFEPLGMEDTSSGDDRNIVPGRAGGYALSETGFENGAFWSHLVPYSAGSLVSTANDLVRYRRGISASDVYSESLRELVETTYPLNDGTENIYALGGLVIGEFEGHRKIAHAGDIWGFSSNHAYYPDDDVTIIILTNRQADAPSTSSFEQKVARVVFDVPQPEILNLDIDPEVLETYAGDYDLHPFIFGPPRYGFAVSDGKLHLSFGGVAAGGPMIPLLAQGDGVFRTPFDDEWIFEFKSDDDSGKIVRLESSYRDGVFYAHRAD